MNNPTSSVLLEQDGDVAQRRGESYPTRGNLIVTEQDRRDWLAVARDIITKSGTKPSQIRRMAAMSGTDMIAVIKSYSIKAPKRSLRDILIHIINSSRSEWTATPTVGEYRKLFEEMSPEPASPSLVSIGLVPKVIASPTVIIPHSIGGVGRVGIYTRERVSSVLIEQQDLEPGGRYDVSHFGQLTKTQKKVLSILGGYTSGPENSPTSYTPDSTITAARIAEIYGNTNKNAVSTLLWQIRRRIQDIQESGEGDKDPSEEALPIASEVVQRGKREKYTPDRLPNLAGVNELFPYLQSAIFAWYGYDGKGNPTNPASYNVSRAKTSQQIATENAVPVNRVQTYLSIARKALGWPPEETVQSDMPISQKPLFERLASQDGEVTLPEFLRKERKVPTPLPKLEQGVPLHHSGETAQTSQPAKRAVVIGPARPIPQQYVYVPPLPPERPPNHVPPKGELKRIFRPTRGSLGDGVVVESFPDAIPRSRETRTFPQPAVPQSVTQPPEVQRKIPQFASYRAALIWAQEQTEWVGIIELRTKTDPLYKDNMALLGWLKQKNLTEIIPLLDQMKVLYGQRISYNVLMDQIIAPLPEEKITLEDIQRNPTWMEKIQDVFQRHGAGDYAGFVDGVNVLLGDIKLAAGISKLVEKYQADDAAQVLALIVDKNWTPQDARHYVSRTPKDIYQYTPEDNADLDRVLDVGVHVKKGVLISVLQDITIKAPIGMTHWLRYQEYKCPKVTLYDFIVALMQKEGGDITSSKAVFHKLQEILGVR